MPDGLVIPSEPQHRVCAADFVRAGGNKDAVYEASLSSDLEVDRGSYLEVLSHDRRSVDLERASRGLPLLLDHDGRRQIGRVENIRLAGGKLRGRVRFSRSATAAELEDDVARSIRKEISIGYRIKEAQFKERDEETILNVTRWEPMEVSLVSIPLDPSVGVGRSMFSTQNEQQEVRPMTTHQSHSKRDTEIAQILEVGDRFNLQEDARSFISEGRSHTEFNAWVLENIDTPRAEDAQPRMVEKPIRRREELPVSERFSLTRMISQLANEKVLNGIEAETHQELVRHGRSDGTYRGKGYLVPISALAGPRIDSRAYMTTIDATSAGNLVGTDLLAGEFVGLLRNRAKVRDLGARVLEGLVGNVSIPRQAAAATAEWVAEGSGATQSDLDTDQITLTPKNLTCNVGYTRNLMLQSSPQIEQLVRDDLRSQIALGVDLAALTGTGTSNQPLGILNTTGIGDVSLGSPDGGAPTWGKILELTADVETANADEGSLAFLANASAKKKLMSTVRESGHPTYILQEPGDRMAGYRFEVSNQVPANLEEGSSGATLSAMIFGNWNDVIIGVWGQAVELIVDPYTESISGRIRVTAWTHADVALRHAEGFSAIQDMVTT